jgi:hypothetical protein
MFIEFLEGSAVAHANFERYMEESTADGAVPLRFECAATAATAVAEIAGQAMRELERRATEEEADILPMTLVATRSEEPSGHQRYRVLAIARLRRPDVDRVVVRVEADP